jgi:ABC-type lipoprotein export system ATPase subunit
VLTQLRDQAAQGAVLVIVTHDPAILEASDSVLTFSPQTQLTQ